MKLKKKFKEFFLEKYPESKLFLKQKKIKTTLILT